jgi:superfamily II DNA or RNA helicase
MAKQDRDYQAEVLLESKKLMKESSDPFVIEAYVGAGKSYMAARLAEYLNKFGMSTLVLARQARLISQNGDEAWGLNLKNSTYSASLGKGTTYPVVYATEGTLANALDTDFGLDSDFIKMTNGFDLIIYDECQLFPFDNEESQCMKIYNHFKRINPKMRMIGLSGSPFRGQEIIYAQEGWDKSKYFWKRATTADASRDRLVKEKWLVDVEYGLHDQDEMIDYSSLDVSEDRQTGGNYDEEKANEILQGEYKTTLAITHDVHKNASKHTLGVLIFAASKFHTEQIKYGLILAGAKPESITIVLDSTPEKERDAVCSGIEDGSIKYFINISVASTGWDLPRLGHIVYMRPVRSLAFLIQSMGRGVRAYIDESLKHEFNVGSTREIRESILLASEKPHCIVDDYAGVMLELGHLLDDPQFEEAQLKKDKEDGETKPCPACNFENSEKAGRCANIIDGDRCEHFWSSNDCHSCGVQNSKTARTCRGCGSVLIDPNKPLLNTAYSDSEFRPCDKMTIKPNNAMTGIVVEWHLTRPDSSLGRVISHYSLSNQIGKRIWYNEIVKKYIKSSAWQSRAYKMGVKGIVSSAAMFDQPIEIAVRKNDDNKFIVRPKFRVSGIVD